MIKTRSITGHINEICKHVKPTIKLQLFTSYSAAESASWVEQLTN